MTRVRRPPIMAAVLAVFALLVAAEPATSQVACPGHTTVRDGETLVSIAARCGVTVPALLAANPEVHDDQDLRVGGSIRVPHPRDPQPTPRQACGEFYTIRDGDTLAEIAHKCGLTVALLVAANGPLPEPLGLAAGGTVRIPNVPRPAVRDTLTWVAPEPVAVAEPDQEQSELIRYRGTLVAGTPCMLLRTADGRTIALDRWTRGGFAPGEDVVVMGVPSESGACDHTPAVEVRILHRADTDPPTPDA